MTTTSTENNRQQDEALDKLFAAYHPALSPTKPFMDSLQQRMEVVNYVRQMQQEQLRRYRMAVVAAFVLGSVAGAVAIALEPTIGQELAHSLLRQLSPAQAAFVETLHLRQALLPALCTLASTAVIALCTRRQKTEKPSYYIQPPHLR